MIFIKEIKNISKIKKTDIILDIRHPEDQKNDPIKIKNFLVRSIPYFKLHKNFSSLDKNKSYILYCNNGMMSKLQLIYLYEKGFKKVKVFLQKKKSIIYFN